MSQQVPGRAFSSPEQSMRGLVEAPIKYAIAIGSGKGGVGKSTVSVNVAVSLAKAGARVGLLDADIYGPNIPTMMGVERLPPSTGNKLVPAEAHGVKLMSIGFLVEAEQPLIWRGPMLHKAIRQFIGDVEWGELDYMIVDLPPGTGDAGLSLAQSLALTGGVIVTLLELPDGQRIDIFGAGGGEKLAQETGVAYLGSIPMDPAVRVGGDEGVPVTVSAPDSPVAQALTAVAERIADKALDSSPADDGGISINLV